MYKILKNKSYLSKLLIVKMINIDRITETIGQIIIFNAKIRDLGTNI